jgi:hypothetical protein
MSWLRVPTKEGALPSDPSMERAFGKLDKKWAPYCVKYAALDRIINALRGVLLKSNARADQHVDRISMSMQLPEGHGESARLHDGTGVTDNDFFQALDAELAKLDEFVSGKVAELKDGTTALEREAQTYAERVVASPDAADAQLAEQLRQRAQRAGEEFLEMEVFANVNFMAFHKILEKHDRFLPQVPCKDFYLAKLQQQGWLKNDFSKSFVLLSKIHAKLRGESPPAQQALATAFSRKVSIHCKSTLDPTACSNTTPPTPP